VIRVGLDNVRPRLGGELARIEQLSFGVLIQPCSCGCKVRLSSCGEVLLDAGAWKLNLGVRMADYIAVLAGAFAGETFFADEASANLVIDHMEHFAYSVGWGT
jgi:hypothetical protein